MRIPRHLVRTGIAAALASVALLVAAGPAAAAETTTLTFKEPEKGSTFAFIDNAPKSERRHGFPTRFSVGDELIFTNPLEAEGKIVGKLRVVCVATQNASSRHFGAAGFNCTGIAKIPGGTLVFVAQLNEGNETEGAIVGGSGTYAGARGSFVSQEGKHSSTVTVTLLD